VGTWVLIIGLAALFMGMVAAIVVAGSIGRERSEISSSLAAIEAIGGPVPDDMRAAYDKPFDVRVRQPAQAWAARASRAVAGANWSKNTTQRLEKAGNPPGWDSERILASKTLAALLLASIVGGLLWVGGRGSLQALLWGIAFGVFGFFLPDLLLLNKAQHRSEQIEKALPDSIDLLTISVESGLAFDAALAQVARNSDGPLAEEFTRVLKEIQIGSSRSQALKALSERTDVEDLRIFLNSMVQAEKLGIPIADVLRVQASEMRIKRSQRTEEKAMQLPVKIIFPLLLCIMPAMFIVILGPAVINIQQVLFEAL
jgi:tight adherence protein C